MLKHVINAWLRPALALFGIAGILVLSGCGGGSGAPNNPYTPPPPVIPALKVIPSPITVYAGTPATLTIEGGVPPYRAFSNDVSILPISGAIAGDTIVVAANNVGAATSALLTVQDAAGTSVPVTVNINPAPLLSSLVTIASNPNPACAASSNTLCSGGTGTATVQVLGPGGAGLKGRTVRFDVVQGPYSIISTNPAQPLVQTLTTVTDSNGNAIVLLSVPPDTPTQSAILRVTDLTSGQQITGNFVIQQITVGGATLAVLPLGTTTITGPDTAHCSTGVPVAFYIFGGTPPYTVATNFPTAGTLSGVPVLKSGGSFTFTTNGSCFTNLTFVITDATGLTIATGNYPFITNQLGTTAPTPPPPTAFVVTPGAIAKNNCVPANTFQFIGTGGTAPYSAVVTQTTSPTSPVINPQTNIPSGTAAVVSGLTSPSNTVITVFDNSSPRQSATVTIDCTGSGTPPTPPQLVVSPSNYNFTLQPPAGPGTCVNQTANYVITGGTAPYTVFFASPRPGAIITPQTVIASGQGFSVTGLSDGVLNTNITVQDASSPPVQVIVTITCPTPSGPNPIAVTPAVYTYVGGPACSGSSSVFTINGGLPPYTVFFPVAGTTGTITPSTVLGGAPPGNQFRVSGLAASPLPQVTNIAVRDSSSVAQTSSVTVDCRP